jgi:hypothetical protein
MCNSTRCFVREGKANRVARRTATNAGSPPPYRGTVSDSLQRKQGQAYRWQRSHMRKDCSGGAILSHRDWIPERAADGRPPSPRGSSMCQSLACGCRPDRCAAHPAAKPFPHAVHRPRFPSGRARQQIGSTAEAYRAERHSPIPFIYGNEGESIHLPKEPSSLTLEIRIGLYHPDSRGDQTAARSHYCDDERNPQQRRSNAQ